MSGTERTNKLIAAAFIAVVLAGGSAAVLHVRMLPTPAPCINGVAAENQVGRPSDDEKCAQLRAHEKNGPSNSFKRVADQDYYIDPQWVQAGAAVGAFVIAWALFGVSRSQTRINAAQTAIARRQARILDRQVALEERRFEQEFRPRLIMTDVHIMRQADESVLVFWELMNTGGIDAEIMLTDAHFGIVDVTAPAISEGATLYDYGIKGVGIIKVGESIALQYPFANMRRAWNSRRDTSEAHFSGRIHYRSINNPRRYILGFDRVTRGQNPIFYVSEDHQREYSH